MEEVIDRRDQEVQRRMQIALELYEFAEAVVRERLKDQYPSADAAEIEQRLTEWLLSRSAEHAGPGFIVRRFSA